MSGSVWVPQGLRNTDVERVPNEYVPIPFVPLRRPNANEAALSSDARVKVKIGRKTEEYYTVETGKTQEGFVSHVIVVDRIIEKKELHEKYLGYEKEAKLAISEIEFSNALEPPKWHDGWSVVDAPIEPDSGTESDGDGQKASGEDESNSEEVSTAPSTKKKKPKPVRFPVRRLQKNTVSGRKNMRCMLTRSKMPVYL